MSRYTLADSLIGYRSAIPPAYDLFGAKPAADQLHRMPPGPRPRAAGRARGVHPLPPAGDPDAVEPLHAGRRAHAAAGTVGMTDRRPELEISTTGPDTPNPARGTAATTRTGTPAHPKAWVRGQAVPGRFYAGALWGSSTLAWDAAWFHAQGVKMPKGAHHVVPGRDKIPLADKLDPTDTGVMRLQFRQIR